MKKIPETDAIFEQVATANQAADDDPTVLRISIDSKAKVKLGNLSRGGKDRRQAPPQADDHDTQWHTTLLPFGILNLRTDNLALYMSESPETSDFIVDCLEHWWKSNQGNFPEVNTLAINLDGGSATRSNRTQFIKRIVEFSRHYQLQIRLIYYPPYHSKYNPIERCWAALEQFWNGAILDSIDTALRWASKMSWKGSQPVVHHVTKLYQTGVKVDPESLADYRVDWHPSESLPKWSVTVGSF
ncbi:ISAzo13-like element transposase-related protein [Euhalothece natronophila]|uniref:ISAzo13-like element transposase-related protein n=1 Tax=Euhalothece natronophila TaxID=577489 RepID=UPI0016479D37|nr:transposase [Euhalothece natronophila]